MSWGDGCADPNKYGVYTKVSEYLDWIAMQAVDFTPPIFDSDGSYPKTANVSYNALDLLVKTDENGTVYYVVLADGATVPTAQQVKNGQNSDGNLVSLSGNQALTVNTEATVNINGLAESTAYDILVVAEDANGNLTIVVTVEVTTPAAPDLIPPIFYSDGSYPKTANVSYNALDLLVKTDENGTIYYVVLADGATVPTAEQVKNGQDSGGNTVNLSGNQALTANTKATVNLTDFRASTAYDIFVVAEDGNGNLTVAQKVEVTTAAPPEQACACLTLGCNLKGETITEKLEVPEGGSISNAILDAQLINHCCVSNLTITPQAIVSGGIITGTFENEGTMKDFEFRGLSIFGGTLAGSIINSSQVGGYFQDVQLAPDTRINGGIIAGMISGDIETPALLENLEIKEDSQIYGVIIGDGVQLPENVNLGAGVRFSKLEYIPSGLDLTSLLSSIDPPWDFEQPPSVDITEDIIAGGEGILKAINTIPAIVEANLIVSQNDDFGYLQADIEGIRFAVNPRTVQHTQDSAGLPIEVAQIVRFKTPTQMDILALPAIQAPEFLQAALADVNLTLVMVKNTGNIMIQATEDIWYSARPYFASTVVEDDAETGLFVKSVTEAWLVFTDAEGQKRQQLFYPAPADMSVLLQSAISVDLNSEGILRFSLAGSIYQGVLDFMVTQGKATMEGLRVIEIADSNNDGLEDFLIYYPNGAQQMLWRLPGMVKNNR